MGPLIDVAFRVDPHTIVVACLTTSIVFISFSFAALFSERRSWLFLGGIFSSFLSIMFFLSIMNLFFRAAFPYVLNLYGGLFVFSLYIIYDTQMIIEKHLRGDKDFIGHAMTLFVDLVAVFVRILIIILRNSEKKDRKKSRR